MSARKDVPRHPHHYQQQQQQHRSHLQEKQPQELDENDDDLFRKTFDYLQKLLIIQRDDENQDNRGHITNQLFSSSELQSFHSFIHDFQRQIFQNKQINQLQYENKKAFLLNLLDHLLTRSKIYQEATKIHQESYFNYLSHQEQHMEVRLKELLLEILGEYVKVLLKAKEIENTFHVNHYHRLNHLIWKYSWKTYSFLFMENLCLNKLTETLSGSNSTGPMKPSINKRVSLLDFEKDRNEIKILMETNPSIKTFLNTPSIVPLNIVKFTLPGNNGSSSIPSSPSKESKERINETIIAESIDQLQRIFRSIDCLYSSYPGGIQRNSAVKKTANGLIDSQEVIKLSPGLKNISYFIQPSLWNEVANFYYPSLSKQTGSLESLTLNYHVQQTSTLLNRMIYVCLEEYSLKFQSFQKESPISRSDPLLLSLQIYIVLEKIYLSSNKGKHLQQSSDYYQTLFREEGFIFSSFEGSHRLMTKSPMKDLPKLLQSNLIQYPDIIRAKSMKTGSILHFIPILYPTDDATSSFNFFLKNLHLSCFFSTIYPQRINHEKKSSTSSQTGGLFTADLMEKLSSKYNHHSNNNGSVSSGISSKNVLANQSSTSILPPPTPIMLKISDEIIDPFGDCVCKGTSFEHLFFATLPDHPRSSLLSQSTKEPVKLNHIYGYFPDPQLNTYYFIQAFKSKGNVFLKDSLIFEQSTRSEESEASDILFQSLFKEMNFDWFTSLTHKIIPEFSNYRNNSQRNPGDNSSNQLYRRCDWRSCLSCVVNSSSSSSSSSSSPSSIALCQYHSQLKEFIDVTMVSSSTSTTGSSTSRTEKSAPLKNSAKFLPKQSQSHSNESAQQQAQQGQQLPPLSSASTSVISQTKRDLKMLRSSSVLLQEIWDGRLKTTIQTFVQKTIQELNYKQFLDNFQGNQFLLASLSQMALIPSQSSSSSASSSVLSPSSHRIPPPHSSISLPICLSRLFSSISLTSPTWMLWKEKERYHSLMKGLNNNLEILNSILNTERFISKEIQFFYELNCFPQQEILMIRKEMKFFKDYQTKLLNDNQTLLSDYSSINGNNGNHLLAQLDEMNSNNPQSSSTPSLLLPAAAASSITSGNNNNHNHNPSGSNNSNAKESYELLYQILLEESKFSELKLLQFSQRRQIEQEMKNAYFRKMMKLKAMEEAELKDPTSFKNQLHR